ncbi:Hypothetical predicted protein [Marmota monax]|uniref:Uncharacterized protein n=1 Tax=Marmota monax TaxID=9995 RepID=A0A5E4A350_MARMO|nr:Hypothetical predicted protein [Marmota monax]
MGWPMSWGPQKTECPCPCCNRAVTTLHGSEGWGSRTTGGHQVAPVAGFDQAQSAKRRFTPDPRCAGEQEAPAHPAAPSPDTGTSCLHGLGEKRSHPNPPGFPAPRCPGGGRAGLTLVQVADHCLLLQKLAAQRLAQPEGQHVVREGARREHGRHLPLLLREGPETPPGPEVPRGARLGGQPEAEHGYLGSHQHWELPTRCPEGTQSGREASGAQSSTLSAEAIATGRGCPPLLPQLPEGDVLVEPQAVVPLLLCHVAPPLPAGTGGLHTAICRPPSARRCWWPRLCLPGWRPVLEEWLLGEAHPVTRCRGPTQPPDVTPPTTKRLCGLGEAGGMRPPGVLPGGKAASRWRPKRRGSSGLLAAAGHQEGPHQEGNSS